MRPGTRFSQIGLGIHRAFRSPCARRGNRGRETVQSSEFSNHPDFHSRVLEKRAADQPILREGLSLLFHFSSLNYGDYYLSSYLLPIFLLSVACYTLASLTRYHDPVFRAVRCVPVRNAGNEVFTPAVPSPQATSAQESRKRSRFPRRRLLAR